MRWHLHLTPILCLLDQPLLAANSGPPNAVPAGTLTPSHRSRHWHPLRALLDAGLILCVFLRCAPPALAHPFGEFAYLSLVLRVTGFESHGLAASFSGPPSLRRSTLCRIQFWLEWSRHCWSSSNWAPFTAGCLAGVMLLHVLLVLIDLVLHLEMGCFCRSWPPNSLDFDLHEHRIRITFTAFEVASVFSHCAYFAPVSAS